MLLAPPSLDSPAYSVEADPGNLLCNIDLLYWFCSSVTLSRVLPCGWGMIIVRLNSLPFAKFLIYQPWLFQQLPREVLLLVAFVVALTG